MYYGYTSAVSPPATWSNIFLFYDTFTGSSLDTGRWGCSGTCTVSGGRLTLQNAGDRVVATATYALGTSTRWETRTYMGGDGTEANLNLHCPATTNDFSGDWICFWTDATLMMAEDHAGINTQTQSWTPSTPTSYHVYTINRETTAGVRYLTDGSLNYYLTQANAIPTGNFRQLIDDDDGSSGIFTDWVRVRKYVTSEPTTGFSTEELVPEVALMLIPLAFASPYFVKIMMGGGNKPSKTARKGRFKA